MMREYWYAPEGDRCWTSRSVKKWWTVQNHQRYIEAQWQQGSWKVIQVPDRKLFLELSPWEYPVAVIQMCRGNASSDVHAFEPSCGLAANLFQSWTQYCSRGLIEDRLGALSPSRTTAFSEHHAVELSAYGSEASIDPCPSSCPQTGATFLIQNQPSGPDSFMELWWLLIFRRNIWGFSPGC